MNLVGKTHQALFVHHAVQRQELPRNLVLRIDTLRR
jgi:hypothetical protein